MESKIKIEYNNKIIRTYHPVSLNELCTVFNCRENGAHLKVKLGSNVKLIWPDQQKMFSTPPKATSAYLIAKEDKDLDLDEDDALTETPTETHRNNLKARRGNAALMDTKYGQRAVPGYKRKAEILSLCPPKKRAPCIPPRTVEMCELRRNEEKNCDELNPIFEIPLNISELESVNVRTICKEIRAQVGDTQYILLNKKSNPIRDMPNTRGKSILTLSFTLTSQNTLPETGVLTDPTQCKQNIENGMYYYYYIIYIFCTYFSGLCIFLILDNILDEPRE